MAEATWSGHPPSGCIILRRVDLAGSNSWSLSPLPGKAHEKGVSTWSMPLAPSSRDGSGVSRCSLVGNSGRKSSVKAQLVSDLGEQKHRMYDTSYEKTHGIKWGWIGRIVAPPPLHSLYSPPNMCWTLQRKWNERKGPIPPYYPPNILFILLPLGNKSYMDFISCVTLGKLLELSESVSLCKMGKRRAAPSSWEC